MAPRNGPNEVAFLTVCVLVNVVLTDDIYEDFHIQAGGIPINRRRRRFCKMLYFVARVGLVEIAECALEFLFRIGLVLGLRLGLVFGCMSPVDMICKYVFVCVCACLGYNRELCKNGLND